MTAQSDSQQTTKNIGLRGIVVADSKISKVDGEKGVLIYRGYDVLPLAIDSSFEEVVYLLLNDSLPKPEQLAQIRQELAEYRNLPDPVIDTMKTLPKDAAPMDVLQAMVPVLAMHDPEIFEEKTWQDSYNIALRLIARLPLIVSAWQRVRNDREVVESNKDLSHAANFLYTLHGTEPDSETAKIMDTILILHADHGFNASTFTARQVTSTLAHFYAAISGALGSLSGALHGGANYRVYKMLEQIGSIDNVRDYVVNTLDNKGKIMGMGHPVYKVTDPRANILGPMAAKLADKLGRTELYEMAEEVRKVTTEEFKKRKGRGIYANVDFFSALVNSMIGIPIDFFTPVFAIGRIAGWSAHYLEEHYGSEQAKPTLYRPKAEYAGRYCGLEGCEWSPVDKR